MFYRSILKNAWQILWRAKFLWIFGLFAILATNSGEVNLVIDNSANISHEGAYLQELKILYSQGLLDNIWHNFVSLFSGIGWSSVLAIVFSLIIFALLIWIVVVSQGALVNGAYKSYRKQVTGFIESFKIGNKKFWKVFGINIVAKLFIGVVTLVIGLPLTLLYFKQTSESGRLIFLLISFIILIPATVVISFLMRYAVMGIIIKKEKFKEAIKNAWKLFIKNWIVSIEMAIVLFFITLVTGLLMIIASVILAIPLSFLIYLFYSMRIGGSLMIALVISLVLFIALLFWFGALFSTFQTSAWVILFDKIDGNKVFSKIARIIGSWGNKKNSETMIEE